MIGKQNLHFIHNEKSAILSNMCGGTFMISKGVDKMDKQTASFWRAFSLLSDLQPIPTEIKRVTESNASKWPRVTVINMHSAGGQFNYTLNRDA